MQRTLPVPPEHFEKWLTALGGTGRGLPNNHRWCSFEVKGAIRSQCWWKLKSCPQSDGITKAEICLPIVTMPNNSWGDTWLTWTHEFRRHLTGNNVVTPSESLASGGSTNQRRIGTSIPKRLPTAASVHHARARLRRLRRRRMVMVRCPAVSCGLRLNIAVDWRQTPRNGGVPRASPRWG